MSRFRSKLVLGCINCYKNFAVDISVIETGTPINSNGEKQQNKRKVYKKKVLKSIITSLIQVKVQLFGKTITKLV